MKLLAACPFVALLLAAPAFAQDDDSEAGLVDGRLVGSPDTVASEPLRPQLVYHDHTTRTVIGGVTAVVGGISLIGAWPTYVARQNFRLRPWLSLSNDTVDNWSSMGAAAFWMGAGGAALLVTSEYLLLPESRDVPTLGWVAGVVGLGVAAVGVGFALGGQSCPPIALRPGADFPLACDSGTADGIFGSLLIFTAVPLISVPIVYLTRRLFAGAPESLSVGPRGVSWSGRF